MKTHLVNENIIIFPTKLETEGWAYNSIPVEPKNTFHESVISLILNLDTSS